jgi:hypothetical protein
MSPWSSTELAVAAVVLASMVLVAYLVYGLIALWVGAGSHGILQVSDARDLSPAGARGIMREKFGQFLIRLARKHHAIAFENCVAAVTCGELPKPSSTRCVKLR